jgi:uncharacterized protein (DUF1778 family)
MGTRTSQLQIRVTPAEKAALQRLASAAGETVSGYVLSRVLPSTELELAHLLSELAEPGADRRGLLRRLERTLETVAPADLAETLPAPEPGALTAVLMNCVAALVETAAHRKGVRPPSWVSAVPPLPRPHFGWPLRSLRPHQIRVSPVPFKRRNVFFDPAVGPSP